MREEDGGSGDGLTLTGLQTLLTEEYGEAHFNAAGQDSEPYKKIWFTNVPLQYKWLPYVVLLLTVKQIVVIFSDQPLLYFQVLFLTGLFESAVDFLFRAGKLCLLIEISLHLSSP